MKLVVAFSVAALGLTGGAAQAQTLRLTQPADLNGDGVVTDAERAEYAASKTDATPWDQPSSVNVAAPRGAGGPSVTFNEGPSDYSSQPRLENRAVQASGFEEYINAEADKGRRR